MKKGPKNYESIGQFTCTSGTLLITDPMYQKGVWCSDELIGCRTGAWDAAVARQDEGRWGVRVGMLVAKAADADVDFAIFDCIYTKDDFIRWGTSVKHREADIGVDSATCGIFDETMYHGNGKWDDETYDLTREEPLGGCLPYGCVAMSGYGDGCYDAFVHRDKHGKIDAVCVVFL